MSFGRLADMAADPICRSARRGIALRLAALEMLILKGEDPDEISIDFLVESWISRAGEIEQEHHPEDPKETK